MTGQTLAVIRNALKAQLGESLSIGTANDALYNQLLVNKQDWFLAEYDWSFLKDHWTVAMAASTRYATIPTSDYLAASFAINFERPVLVEVSDGLPNWSTVEYGIDAELFNTVNSEGGEVDDPIYRWQLKDGAPTSFEVWPVPATAQTLRFTGQRRPTAINVNSDASTFVLDHLLLAYSLAADLLAERKKPSAAQITALAQKRFASIRGKDPKALRTFGIGSSSCDREKPGYTRVRVV